VAWNNDELVLFHGCSELSLRPANPRGIGVGIIPHGIDPLVGAVKPDFGRGFYATTLTPRSVWILASNPTRMLMRCSSVIEE
jgi:hypothetical protein